MQERNSGLLRMTIRGGFVLILLLDIYEFGHTWALCDRVFGRMWENPSLAGEILKSCLTPDYMPIIQPTFFQLTWKYIALVMLTGIFGWLTYRTWPSRPDRADREELPRCLS